MIIYLFFLILSLLPLFEGEPLGIGQMLFLSFCLPLSIYLYRRFKGGFGLSLFLVFLFFAFLATVFSPVFSRSFSTLILYFAYLIWFLAVQNLALESRQLFKSLLSLSILLPSLILSFLSFYLLFSRQPPPFSAMNLIFANFGHNHLIDFLIFSFPVSLILFLEEKESKKKLLFLLVNLVLLAGFMVSFSRGGLLMVLLEILFFVVWNKKKGKLFYPLLIGGICLLILSLMIGGYVYLKTSDFKLPQSFILEKALRQPSFASRFDYYRQAVLAFQERPIFGWGLDNFRYLSVKYQKSPSYWSFYPHCHFLQLLAETGIFGGLLFLILVWQILKKILLSESVGFNLGLKIGLIGSVIHSLFDYDWQFTSVFLLFWVIAGYLVSGSQAPVVKKKAFLLLGGLIFLVAVLEFSGTFLVTFGNFKGLTIWPFKLKNWQIALNNSLDEGDEQKALLLLEQLIKREPLESQNYKKLADLALKQNQPKLALVNYQKVLELSPKEESELFYQVIDLWPKIETKNWPWFFTFLTDLEKLKGPHCLLKCLEFENEEKILNILLELEQSSQLEQLDQLERARVYYWLAILSTYRKDWDQDITYLEKAIELDDEQEYRLFLDDLLMVENVQSAFENNDFDTVKSLALVFEQKEKNHLFYEKFYLDEVYLALGKISYQEEDLAKAASYWQKAIDINQWSGEGYLHLAKIYQEEGRIDQARQILGRCLELDWWGNFCRKELGKLPLASPKD